MQQWTTVFKLVSREGLCFFAVNWRRILKCLKVFYTFFFVVFVFFKFVFDKIVNAVLNSLRIILSQLRPKVKVTARASILLSI